MTRFDLTPLSTRPTSAEANALRQRNRAGEFGPPPSHTREILLVVILLVGLSWFIQIFTVLIPRGSYWHLVVWAGLATVVTLVVVRLIRWTSRETWMPLVRFADSNNLAFIRSAAGPSYPGVVFGRENSSATDHVWSPSGVFADAGKLSYTTGSGKGQRTHLWHFIAYRLPRDVPHLVLDSKSNDSTLGSNLPTEFSATQRLRLGDPFDTHFTLYAPKEYEQDAFQLLSPDVIEEVLRVPGQFDLELVDSWLFLYTPYPVNLAEPGSWQFIQEVQDGLLRVLARNLDHYQDERSKPGTSPSGPSGFPSDANHVATRAPQIAFQGQRLQRSNGPMWLVVVAFLAALALLGLIWWLVR